MSERDAEVLDRLHAELIRQANRHREGQIPLDGSTVAEWKNRRARVLGLARAYRRLGGFVDA